VSLDETWSNTHSCGDGGERLGAAEFKELERIVNIIFDQHG